MELKKSGEKKYKYDFDFDYLCVITMLKLNQL
jgi:hypothetical protein